MFYCDVGNVKHVYITDLLYIDRIGGLMVILYLSVVNCGFEPNQRL